VRLPRDLTGAELVRRLAKLGYGVTRQSGSHMRLTSQLHGEHHVTVPRHDPLRAAAKAEVTNSSSPPSNSR